MYRGWLQLGGAELTNTTRLMAHTRPRVPESWEEALAQRHTGDAGRYIGYDDSWPDLGAFLGDEVYTMLSAPWYDPQIPQSREFMGVWVMKVDGFGAAPVDRPIQDAITMGGVASAHRLKARGLTITAILIASTNAGAEYGASWLQCRLQDATGTAGTTLEFLAAHPENSSADPQLLRRVMSRVLYTREMKETTTFGLRGQENRQGAVKVVDFELGVLDPYVYGPATSKTVTWSSTITEQIQWAHPPDCEDPDSCTDIPILASATCIPATVDVSPVQPPICAGCIPLCSVTTRIATVPAAQGVMCRDEVVSLTVTAGAAVTSVNVWFRPCGSTELCDRTGYLSLAGLPAGATIVADAVMRKTYGLVGGQQVRQYGIVHTPSGAPWTAPVLDSGTCWELVAQHEPGLDFSVEISVRGRQS